MPKIKYVDRNFSAASLDLVAKANTIIANYQAQGYDLTLRQLYYQFVTKNFFANTEESYKRLGSVVNDARLAGLIDWDAITDRTRSVETITSWDSPSSIVSACASQFKIDFWKTQPYYVEVWIEKEALAGVFERVCTELRVPYLSCRGYTSQSEMWRAGRRLGRPLKDDKLPVVLHFGDHDPSGIDMSRDVTDRLKLFMGGVQFERLALNMDQVDQYSPPPNPAKVTDSRAKVYIQNYGHESWELDALDPTVLADLVRDRINQLIDHSAWSSAQAEEDEHRRVLTEIAENWDDVVGMMEENGEEDS